MKIRSIAGVACALAIILGTLAESARAAGSHNSEEIQARLKTIEGALGSKDWRGALNGADDLLGRMVNGDFRGPGSRTAYGLVFAFRALAEEELGRPYEADWSWGCVRALAESISATDFSPFGGAQERIRQRETARGELPSRLAELVETHGGSRVTAPLKQSAEIKFSPASWSENPRHRTLEWRVRIGLDGRAYDPRPESDEDLSSETALFVWIFLQAVDWKYQPAKLDGDPIEVVWDMHVDFRVQ